jgi:rhodanese-related sulfurtransferase
MKTIVGLVWRAALIAVVCGAMGVCVNLISAKPLPWRYEPPRTLEVAGVEVRLIDEREAKALFGNPDIAFVDSRETEDFEKAHVEGAVHLPPKGIEDRFASVEPLLPREYKIVLYCYGPECDSAERVAGFLAKKGYRNMVIMSAGFPAWEKAAYPAETSRESD